MFAYGAKTSLFTTFDQLRTQNIIIIIIINIIFIDIIIIITFFIIYRFYNLGSQTMSSYQKHRQVLTN